MIEERGIVNLRGLPGRALSCSKIGLNEKIMIIKMEVPQGKHAWMIKIGEKGQFVIPKEARVLFGFQPGQTILVLADEKRGLAIPPRADSQRIMSQIIDELQKEGE